MTFKQQAAIKLITEKHRPVSVAMKEVGYAQNTYSKPKNLTESDGYKEMLAQYLPLNDAFNLTKDAYKAEKVVTMGLEEMNVPDHAIRLKAADQTYKLHGVLADSGALQGAGSGGLTVVYNFTNASRPSDSSGSGDNYGSETIQDAQLAPESPQDDVRDGQIDPGSEL